MSANEKDIKSKVEASQSKHAQPILNSYSGQAATASLSPAITTASQAPDAINENVQKKFKPYKIIKVKLLLLQKKTKNSSIPAFEVFVNKYKEKEAESLMRADMKVALEQLMLNAQNHLRLYAQCRTKYELPELQLREYILSPEEDDYIEYRGQDFDYNTVAKLEFVARWAFSSIVPALLQDLNYPQQKQKYMKKREAVKVTQTINFKTNPDINDTRLISTMEDIEEYDALITAHEKYGIYSILGRAFSVTLNIVQTNLAVSNPDVFKQIQERQNKLKSLKKSNTAVASAGMYFN